MSRGSRGGSKVIEDDTLSFNAWEINDKRTHVTRVIPPRLHQIIRSRKQTPKGERRKRLLLPQGCGPFGVGSFDVMTDPGSKGIFFRLFYPITKWNIDKDPSIEYPPWIPSRKYCAGFAKYMSLMGPMSKSVYMRFFEQQRSRIYVPTLTNARIISPDDHTKELPVIVFSHGLSSCRSLSSTICMDWASYGFVVAAVEHRDGSAAYTYHLKPDIGPKGSTSHKPTLQDEAVEDNDTFYTEHGMLIINVTPIFDFGVRNHQLSHRRREVTNCLNALTRLNLGMGDQFILIDPRTGLKGKIKFLKDYTLIDMFLGRLNLSEAIVAGHSFGGATGLVSVLKDGRFKCGVVMDPWTTPLGPEVYETNAFSRPFLMIDSDKWFSGKNDLSFLRILLADQVRALAACPSSIGSMICTLRDTNHQSFTDFLLICGPKVGRMFGLRDKSEPVKVIQCVRQLSIAYIKEKANVRSVCWPQGSKHILQAVRGGEHMEIKHGHRFLKNLKLGYELEMQRLIAFERRANKDKAHDFHVTEHGSHHRSIALGKFVSSTHSVAKQQKPIKKTNMMEGPHDTFRFRQETELISQSTRWSTPEFSEARSFYREEKNSCCSCCMPEIRKVKAKPGSTLRRVLSDSEEESIYTDARWLHRATNFPLEICYYALMNFPEMEEAEKWLNYESFMHGYRKPHLSLPRGLVSLITEKNVCSMVELKFHGSNPRAVKRAAADPSIREMMTTMNNILLSQCEKTTGTVRQVYSGEQMMDLTKGSQTIKTVFISCNPKDDIKLTLRRGAVYRPGEGEEMSSLLLWQAGVVSKSNFGASAAMVLYKRQAGSKNVDQVSTALCYHVITFNPLTIGDLPVGDQPSAEGLELASLATSHDKARREDAAALPNNKLPAHSRTTMKRNKNYNAKSKNVSKQKGMPKPSEFDETRLLHQRFTSKPNRNVGESLRANGMKVLDFVKFECNEGCLDACVSRAGSSTSVEADMPDEIPMTEIEQNELESTWYINPN